MSKKHVCDIFNVHWFSCKTLTETKNLVQVNLIPQQPAAHSLLMFDPGLHSPEWSRSINSANVCGHRTNPPNQLSLKTLDVFLTFVSHPDRLVGGVVVDEDGCGVERRRLKNLLFKGAVSSLQQCHPVGIPGGDHETGAGVASLPVHH